MKKVLSAAAVAAIFILSGCASSAASQEPAASAAATPAETTAGFTVSAETTCEQLHGTDSDGPLFDAIYFVAGIDEINDETMAEAEPISDDLNGIAKRANTDMRPLVAAVVEPIDGMLANETGTYTLDPDDFKAAATELLNQCPGQEDSAPEAVEPEHEITSGDIETDLTAAGVESDDYEETADSLALVICRDYDLIPTGKKGWDGLMDQMGPLFNNGDWNTVVRTIVAYKCPDRAEDAEEHML